MSITNKTSLVSALVKNRGKGETFASLIARAHKTIGAVTPAEIEAWLSEMNYLYSVATMVDGRSMGGAEVGALEDIFIAEGRVLAALLPAKTNLRKHPSVKAFLKNAASMPEFAEA